ncbi:MAG: serine/threonine protein kinase [Gemmataceae bacterium]|nr:serine/threonine protein kinase [Gemmataceae bacterium]
MAHAQTLHADLKPYPGYRLRQLLGVGGFSEVWEAEVDGGSSVALKFMPCDNGMAAAKEIRSIQKMKQLVHPNLVGIDKIWCYENYIVIAMELAEGDLDDLFQAYQAEFNTAVVPEQVCMYLTHVAHALDFLNSRQHRIDGRLVSIQHCDVKPSNMLLYGETVKLGDFGLSVQTSSNRKMNAREGTLAFAAPEVFSGQVSSQSDQYALAISYCYLRSGRFPFPQIDSFRQSWPRRRPPPDLTMLSEEERPIILKALSRVPLDRWPSCLDMMKQLTKIFA